MLWSSPNAAIPCLSTIAVWGNQQLPRSRDGWLMSDAAPTICLHASYRCVESGVDFCWSKTHTQWSNLIPMTCWFFFLGILYNQKLRGRWDIASHLIKDPWCLFVLYNGIIHNCLENCSIEVQVSSWTSVMSQFSLESTLLFVGQESTW